MDLPAIVADMPTPEFILTLREKIGTDLLWLPGVTGVVVDDAGRVLLVRRSDTLRWTLVTGCLDPGEQPAHGIVREILEETGVDAEVVRVLAVESTRLIEYPHGDLAQYMDVAFLCRALGGVAKVNDDESVDVRWHSPDELPELPERQAGLIKRYLDGDDVAGAWFDRP
jgi:8-oxo-dGTP pyrophosphatase MutT (NUDIX family)